MAVILKMSKYKTLLHFKVTYETIVPIYAMKIFFMVITSSMTSQGDHKIISQYSFIYIKRTIFMIIGVEQRSCCAYVLWDYEYIFIE